MLHFADPLLSQKHETSTTGYYNRVLAHPCGETADVASLDTAATHVQPHVTVQNLLSSNAAAVPISY